MSSSAEASAPTSHAVAPSTDIGPKATGPPAYVSARASTSPPAAAVAALAVIRSGHDSARRPIITAAATPAASATANSSTGQPGPGCCEPGAAANSGSSGSGPRTTENSETLVPVPSAKPGPASTAIPHSAAFGTSATSMRNSPVSPASPPPICRCAVNDSSACAMRKPAASRAAAAR